MAKAKARKGKMRISAVAAAAMVTGATGATGPDGASGAAGGSGTAAQGVVKERGERTLRRLRPLDLYERKGWITKRQSFAGDVLYWLWAIGVHGARPEGDALPPEVAADVAGKSARGRPRCAPPSARAISACAGSTPWAATAGR